jgi:hypothetical protein
MSTPPLLPDYLSVMGDDAKGDEVNGHPDYS